MLPLLFSALLCACPAGAQSPAATPPLPQPASHAGSVLFSRSSAAEAALPARSLAETASPQLAAAITDAMRTAPTFTAYDFAVHLQPATAGIEAQLRVTLRNDGPVPLAALPLQLGSTLHFEHIRLAGRPLPFATHSLPSDADHTGSLTEAAVALPSPLAPGASIALSIDYSGTIAPSSQRLDRIGTPARTAARSDWDRIEEGFTGLRGFGNTVWYPVASTPALLGDGARLFHEIERQKQQNSAASVRIDLTAEFAGDAPNVAVLDGRQVATGAPASLPSATFPGILRATLPATRLGFAVPSLVLASRVPAAASPLLAVASLPQHAEAAPAYLAAAGLLQPLLADWFGPQPNHPLLLVDLPIDDAEPASDGDALLLSAGGGSPSQLAGSLAAPLARASFHSPRPWLSEGVPSLLRILWTERTDGREAALAQLGSGHSALALAEPATPGGSGGQPLIPALIPVLIPVQTPVQTPAQTPAQASAQAASGAVLDPVFYRAKATDVLWTLRALAGDAALASALRAYDPAGDTTPEYFERLLQGRIPPPQVAPEPGVTPPDLHAFFESWIYADPGLPDLAIANVFPSRAGSGDQWLVAVQVANSGYAEAVVPLTVRSDGTELTELVQVPARGSFSRRFLIAGKPAEVDVNDGSVPEIGAGIHRRLLQ